ncbi:hypothetical protein ACHAWF_009180 [Thalassiosira exigua]
MEEPPKIERIVASQGISLSDTASILKAYLSTVDQYHHEAQPAAEDDADRTETSTKGDLAEGDNGKGATPRKSRQEREEEALIAQMDRLAEGKSSGMISDDVYERLQMITKSICAEVEGKPLSASGMTSPSKGGTGRGGKLGEGQITDDGADEFLAELDEAERIEEVGTEDSRRKSGQSNRDKKKEKKAKKAAKKAKKEAKRKAKEIEGSDGHVRKKAKVNE